MKYRNILIGVLAVVLLGAAAFLSQGPSDARTTVGVLVPLTGKSASIGERVRAGVEAGVAELKDEGVDLNVVFEDDKGEATAAVSAAQKLMNTDRVRILIGTVKSDAMLAVAPVTEKERVILLSPTAGAESISNAGDYVFRVIETPDIHGKAAAEKLLPEKDAALFVAQAANAQSYGKFFKQNYLSGGGLIVFETSYQQDAADFRTDISRAVAAKPRAVYLAVATAKDAGILTRQLRETGFMGPIMASVAADAPEFFEAAGSYAEGTLVSSPFFDANTEVGTTFSNRYRSLTGKDADGFAANGYDAIMLVGKALKHCGGDKDTDCIRDFLYATKNYSGAGGALSFDANGDVSKPVLLKVAHGGKFVPEQH